MKIKILYIITVAAVFMMSQPATAAMRAEAKSGVERQYYENGKVHLETRFKNGQIVRKKAFYRNGQLKIDYRYKQGEQVKITGYYENGHLQSLWTQKSGRTKHYHPDGTLRMEVDTRPERANKELKSTYILPDGR